MTGNPDSSEADPRQQLADRQISRNWYLLSGVTILSTLGLAVAVAPVVAQRLGAVWPWPDTHLVLLGGLVVSVVLLVAHLTVQQRRVTTIRSRIADMEEASVRRQRQTRARLHALLNISRMMGAVTDPENVFKSITDTCLEIFECQQASLMLLSEDKETLVVRAATGHVSSKNLAGSRQKITEGVAGYVARNKEPLLLNPDTDSSRHPGLELRNPQVSAAMVVPILLRDEFVGVLSVSSRVPHTYYDEEDVRAALVFAENAGTVIRHSEQAQWMRETIDRLRAQVAQQTASPPGVGADPAR